LREGGGPLDKRESAVLLGCFFFPKALLDLGRKAFRGKGFFGSSYAVERAQQEGKKSPACLVPGNSLLSPPFRARIFVRESWTEVAILESTSLCLEKVLRRRKLTP